MTRIRVRRITVSFNVSHTVNTGDEGVEDAMAHEDPHGKAEDHPDDALSPAMPPFTVEVQKTDSSDKLVFECEIYAADEMESPG